MIITKNIFFMSPTIFTFSTSNFASSITFLFCVLNQSNILRKARRWSVWRRRNSDIYDTIVCENRVCFSFGTSCLGEQSSMNLLFVTSKIVPSTIFTNLAPVIIEVTHGSTSSLSPISLISP